MSAEPRVSVLVTAYNREAFIGDAIQSVLDSSYQDFEVIVVDDASNDSTWAIITKFSGDTRLKMFRNPENIGDYPNRNRAASYARGEYLKYVDSDDILYRHSLAAFVESMDKFPQAGFGLSQSPVDDIPYPDCLTPEEAYTVQFCKSDIFGRPPGAAIIRHSAFAEVGGFGNFGGRGQIGDLDLWLRLAKRFSLVRLQRDLVWDRRHADQESALQGERPFERQRTERQLEREALYSEGSPIAASAQARLDKCLQAIDAATVLKRIAEGNIRDAERYRRACGVPVEAIGRAIANRMSRGQKPDFRG